MFSSIRPYIEKHYGSQKAFAEKIGVTPTQVTPWVNGKWVVGNGKIYSPRRDLPPVDGMLKALARIDSGRLTVLGVGVDEAAARRDAYRSITSQPGNRSIEFIENEEDIPEYDHGVIFDLVGSNIETNELQGEAFTLSHDAFTITYSLEYVDNYTIETLGDYMFIQNTPDSTIEFIVKSDTDSAGGAGSAPLAGGYDSVRTAMDAAAISTLAKFIGQYIESRVHARLTDEHNIKNCYMDSFK